MPKCITHFYACDCREAHFAKLEKENSTFKEALHRAYRWGGIGSDYDLMVSFDLASWIEGGMAGPLPDLPDDLTDSTK